MNMYIPVGSSALETAFQLAIIVNFCRAVSGSRGSVAAGGGGDTPSFPFWLRDFVLASLLSSQPMLRVTPCVARRHTNPHTTRRAGGGGEKKRTTITTAARPENRRSRAPTQVLPLPFAATSVFQVHGVIDTAH